MKKLPDRTSTVKLAVLSLFGTLLVIFLFALALAGPPRPPKIELPDLFKKPAAQKKEELIPATTSARKDLDILPPAPMSTGSGINSK